jgi:hypothetical protein
MHARNARDYALSLLKFFPTGFFRQRPALVGVIGDAVPGTLITPHHSGTEFEVFR